MQRSANQRRSQTQSVVAPADAGVMSFTYDCQMQLVRLGKIFSRNHTLITRVLLTKGFLYNDAGNLTLIWSSFDSDYEKLVGPKHPWTLTVEERTKLETSLLPAPSGGRWRFSNPAQCKQCGEKISAPITRTIYYLEFEGSIVTHDGPNTPGFKIALA